MLASSRPVYCEHCCDDPVTQATKYFNKFIKERKEIYKPIELKIWVKLSILFWKSLHLNP